MKRSINLLLAFLVLWILPGLSQAKDRTIYYHTDALGSVVAATDEHGDVLWRESYKPFGERQKREVGTEQNTPFYTGKPHDDITGLSYFGARYYDPEIGRFMGIDPVGVDPGNIHSFNRYAYANNNPYTFVDPDGRDSIATLHKNGDMSINIPIKFSGPGANSANINAIKNDISTKWSKSYNILGRSRNVAVSVTDPVEGGVVNNITLTNGPTSRSRCRGCSFVRGGNSGEWNAASMGNGVAAHEAGHLMGAEDHYTETLDANNIRISATPDPGYRGNLMGELPGVTGDNNMMEIMRSPRNHLTVGD